MSTAMKNNSVDVYKHGEADRSMIIQLLDATEKGMRNILIQSVGSDIITILLGQFELISQKYNDLNTCIGFRKSKDYIVYDINETFTNLGPQIVMSLAFLHALTGSDTTSSFHRKIMLVAWEVGNLS